MVDIDVSRIMHCFGVRYFVVLSDDCAYCVQEAVKLMMLAIMTKIIVVPG